MGYKRNYGDERIFELKVRLTKEEYDELERVARASHKSKSDVVREALDHESKRFWRYSEQFLMANPDVLLFHYD